MDLLGSDVASLLHEASPVVPEAVVESQLVLQLLRLLHARVRVLPFKGCQPEEEEKIFSILYVSTFSGTFEIHACIW